MDVSCTKRICKFLFLSTTECTYLRLGGALHVARILNHFMNIYTNTADMQIMRDTEFNKYHGIKNLIFDASRRVSRANCEVGYR